MDNRIKELRLEKGLSQRKLSEKTGISQQALSLYEKGQRNPKIETWQKLANYFGVSIAYLQNKTKTKNLFDWVEKSKSMSSDVFDDEQFKKKWDKEFNEHAKDRYIEQFKAINNSFNITTAPYILKNNHQERIALFELLNKASTDDLEKIVNDLSLIYAVYINDLLGNEKAKKDIEIITQALKGISGTLKNKENNLYRYEYTTNDDPDAKN